MSQYINVYMKHTQTHTHTQIYIIYYIIYKNISIVKIAMKFHGADVRGKKDSFAISAGFFQA